MKEVNSMYLGWFDDNPKKSVEVKIREGIAAYTERFKTQPTIVFMHKPDMIDYPGVEVRSETYIRKHNFWIGMAQ